jgi:hypothetical protein
MTVSLVLIFCIGALDRSGANGWMEKKKILAMDIIQGTI